MKNKNNMGITKEPSYKSKISPEIMDRIQEAIRRIVLVEKRYKDKGLSAIQLANELDTNTRYISAVFSVRFHSTFNVYINRLRVEEAMSILTNKKYYEMRMQDISDMVGFRNRQSFYSAFEKFVKISPREFKNRFYEELNTGVKKAK